MSAGRSSKLSTFPPSIESKLSNLTLFPMTFERTSIPLLFPLHFSATPPLPLPTSVHLPLNTESFPDVDMTCRDRTSEFFRIVEEERLKRQGAGAAQGNRPKPLARRSEFMNIAKSIGWSRSLHYWMIFHFGVKKFCCLRMQLDSSIRGCRLSSVRNFNMGVFLNALS